MRRSDWYLIIIMVILLIFVVIPKLYTKELPNFYYGFTYGTSDYPTSVGTVSRQVVPNDAPCVENIDYSGRVKPKNNKTTYGTTDYPNSSGILTKQVRC